MWRKMPESRIIDDVETSHIVLAKLPDLELWAKIKSHNCPISFDLEITARCNNDCRHCYICKSPDDSSSRAKELSVDEIMQIADQAVSMGILWCNITGGEPLLREDFSEVYTGLKRMGLLVSLFTNACLIREEHIELFKIYPPRDIEVTVYGITKETYESVSRRPGSYDAFQRGLNLLLKNGIPVRLKTMALRSNVRELPRIAEFCRSRTKDYFRFDPLLHLRLDRDPVRNEVIKSERLSPEEIVAIERADSERFNALEKGCNKLIRQEFCDKQCNHLFHCGTGAGSFVLGCDGRFRLCSSLSHPDCTYDLRNGNLADAWKEFVPKVQDMRSNRSEFLETCRTCPIINLCLWCPAHAYLEMGELDSNVPYFCQVAYARAKSIIKENCIEAKSVGLLPAGILIQRKR
jgi:radical SAM protein with 4Fe4S-binding SPASM domain